MGSILLALATLFIGVTLSLPLKNNEVDDFVFRSNDLSRFSPYSEIGANEALEKARIRGRRLSTNPQLYDYYVNALDAIYGRREDPSIESSERRGIAAITKKNFDEIDRTGFKHLKRNFDEIDRVGFSELKRSV